VIFCDILWAAVVAYLLVAPARALAGRLARWARRRWRDLSRR
jgi:hypothetical protein